MDERAYKAFIKVVRQELKSTDKDKLSKDTLIFIGWRIGFTIKQLHKEFTELYKKDED